MGRDVATPGAADGCPGGRVSQPIATMRSIGVRARSATASGTLTAGAPSRSASRSLGSVIIFMNRQLAASLAAMKSTPGAASRSPWSIPVSVATIAVRPVSAPSA